MDTATRPACLRQGGKDMRKTARTAAARGHRTADVVATFEGARTLLRNEDTRQAGFRADMVERFGDRDVAILFLSGERHRRQRAATARFFAPKAVQTRYRAIMTDVSDRLVKEFQKRGSAYLDRMAMRLAVTVAAEIVGLTASEPEGMTQRLEAFFAIEAEPRSAVERFTAYLRGQWRLALFYWRDVRPAIAERRLRKREDVISHLIDEGYSIKAIVIECITYAAAGMVTTREFITVAAWHLLEDAELRARFLDTDEEGKIALLEELLRLEPVVGSLFRKGFDPADPNRVAEIDVRAANVDESAVGPCPFLADPDRNRAPRVGAAGIAFGDGAHRCPGAGVAMQESMIFLDRLLRDPGIRLASLPEVGWNPFIAGYELRNASIAVERRIADQSH